MNFKTTEKYFYALFEKLGFVARSAYMIREFGEVNVVAIARKGFGKQVVVDIGFWLNNLHAMRASKVEECHLYIRLERLVPQLREDFLMAADYGNESQYESMRKFESFFESFFPVILSNLTSEVGLAFALRSGELDYAIVRKEARQFLQKKVAQ